MESGCSAGGESSNEPLHRFGSAHTTLKLQTLEKYLQVYTTALKNLSFTLHYIDAFAGTGWCDVRIADEILRIPGSASIAINCRPAFHKLTFIEQSPSKVKALEALKAAATTRNITIVRADANDAVPDCLSALSWTHDRAVVFLDPFGMQVAWSTLQHIAATEFTDLLYLFPLSGLYRQAALDSTNIDADKAASLYRIFGTHEWRDAFYAPSPQTTLFDPPTDVRKMNVPGMVDWVTGRLKTIFAAVADPMILYQATRSGRKGPPIFALFFAISNPSPKAIGLALRLANGILKQA